MFKKITSTLIVGSVLATLSFAKENSFNYYSDGIYDGYIQISKDIQSGLNERYMAEYDGKYLVMMDVTDSSIVDIIFYKTVGAKNSLKPITVDYVENGRTYLVFDSFLRSANAHFLQKKLIEYGLETKVYLGEGAESYKRNPVVIKKMIEDLKYAIRNVPVKVVTVEADGNAPALPPIRRTSGTQSYTSEGKHDNVVVDFLELQREYCRSGEKKGDFFYLRGKKYKVGDSINGLSITRISNAKITLLGTDGKYYNIQPGKCEEDGRGDESKVEITKEVVETKENEATTSATTTTTVTQKGESTPTDKHLKYMCDFTQIYTAKNEEGEDIRISDTPYFNSKQKEVYAQGVETNSVKVRSSGADTIILSSRHFKKYCERK